MNPSHAPAAVASALYAIGNTPVVELKRITSTSMARVFLKLESLNPTGSYKDRMALAMIESAEERGDIEAGRSILMESTAGSTGSSLAFVSAIKGYTFRAITSDAFAPEKLRTMQAFGAELDIVKARDGKITPDLSASMMQKGRQEAKSSESCFFIDQFYNTDALKGYRQIGEELLKQIPGQISAFCAAVGTAGMLMGVSAVLRSNADSEDKAGRPRIVLVEPSSSPVVAHGNDASAGTHNVEGISPGFRPPHLRDDHFDEVMLLDEKVARQTAKDLARKEGLLCGTSTGLNVAAALRLASSLPADAIVVTVACDTGLKYLNTSLYE